MCGSQKYPYPSNGERVFGFVPSTLLDIHVCLSRFDNDARRLQETRETSC